MIVAFTRSNNIGSFLIRCVTWSRFSHVAIVSDDEQFVVEALMFKGVVKTPMNDFIKRNDCVELATMPGDAADAEQYIGKKYDWSALIGLLLHRDWGKSERWFCSEKTAKVSAIFRENRRGRITPEHCYMISKFIKRIKG